MPKHPPSWYKKETINIEHNVTQATLAVKDTEAVLTEIRRILKATTTPNNNAALSWKTTSQVAKSLRYQLNLRRIWLEFRRKFLATHKLVDGVTEAVRSNIIDASTDNNLAFSPPSRYGKHDKNYNEKITALNFQAGLATPEQYATAWRVHKQWFDLCMTVDIFWDQSRELLTLPPWAEIKPVCPLNGRPAYSVLMALHTGRPERANPPHNQLFGWCGDPRYRGSKTGDENIPVKLKTLSRNISSRRKQLHGPAPSVTTGRALLQSEVYPYQAPFQWKPLEFSQRRVYVISCRYDVIYQRTLCGHGDCTASMLRHLHHANSSKLDIWHRIVLKVMQLPAEVTTEVRGINVTSRTRPDNAVLTALTGPVVHISGSDYYAPCIYAEKKHGQSWHRESTNHTTYGYVLLRQGWPNMMHCSEAEFNALQNNNSIGLAGLVRQLDTSSAGYFDRIREEKEAKLTSNQRYARMLKALRSIFLPITKDDSYKAGNCRSGTASFVDRVKAYTKVPLEDQTAEISGRELARCWRASKYLQPDNFNNVVKYMVKKQAAQIQLAYDSLDALFPAGLAWMPGMEWQFPVETETPKVDLYQALLNGSVIGTSNSPGSITITDDYNGEAQPTITIDGRPERLVSHWTPVIRNSEMVMESANQQ